MPSSIYYVPFVHGECYPTNFRIGKLFTIISVFGDLMDYGERVNAALRTELRTAYGREPAHFPQ